VPTAWLDVNFSSMDDYLGCLSAGTRKDCAAAIHQHIQGEAHRSHGSPARVMSLYEGTRDRSDWKFETLTAGFFASVLENMPERSLLRFRYYSGRRCWRRLWYAETGRFDKVLLHGCSRAQTQPVLSELDQHLTCCIEGE
jgi:predicted N-acyltransferase